MKVTNYKGIELEDVDVKGAKNTKIRWLIDERDKAPNFAMRMFEVEKDGNTPFHFHEWEHEVFVIQGEGKLVFESEEIPFKKWDVIFVDPNKKHQFVNTGNDKLRFLCIVPHKKSESQKTNKNTDINPFASGKANNC